MPVIVILLILLLAPIQGHTQEQIHPEHMNCEQTVRWATDSYMNIFKDEKVPAPMSREKVESKFRAFLQSRPDSPCFNSSKHADRSNK